VSEWLQQVPAERLALWIFMAGVAWNRIAAHTKSLRRQGERLGDLEKDVANIAGSLGVKLITRDRDRGGDGR